MTAIVHLMFPPFVPDFTIHVDSLEIYDVTSLCVSSYQAHSQGGGGGGDPPSPVRCLSSTSSSYGTYKNALGPKVSRFSYLAR